MRIVQITDSLEAGGAERMAVSYANALATKIEFSGLVVTRKEGSLVNQIDKNVSYLYLNKKRTVDFSAVFKLRKYMKQNRVTVVHAHGTSFFTAVLLKLIHPKVKIIWHEHYGARAKEHKVNNLILILSSYFFSAIFVVNHQLEDWVKKNLFVNRVSYIPNFAISDRNQLKVTFLKGEDGNRIVCVANLKNPKNHMAILTAFKELKLDEVGWSLHLIGKDYDDDYSGLLKEFISNNNLEDFIFIYGSRNDIQHILSQAAIAVLASTDEGFPVTLLEYGLAKLSVLSTNVGYCSSIIEEDFNGLLFDPLNQKQLQQQLYKMILDPQLRGRFGLHLQELVLRKYSKDTVMKVVVAEYKGL